MFYIALVFIVISVIVLLALLANANPDYAALRNIKSFAKYSKESSFAQVDREINQKFSFLGSYIGASSVSKLFILMLPVAFLGCILLGPYLTNQSLGVFLGMVITAAYVSRIFFHMSVGFRTMLLSQLERILTSIRNNLSTGMTLDYSVNECLKYNTDAPLGPHLNSFIKLSEANFIEKFPLWMHNVQRMFRLNELAQSAQLLKLELMYNSNQEQAFMNAAELVSNRQKQNKKQFNTIYVTFFTLDFMTLAFMGVIFYVIPSFNASWWTSPERPMVIFFTALIIWGAYAMTVLISLWRQS